MAKRGRGRPRAYDPDTALNAALGAFWKSGFAATSLDDISAATGMNRPSLYGAFGDKKSLYRKALGKFSDEFLGGLEKALFGGRGIEEDLVSFYMAALPTYLSGSDGGLGCPVLCTAPTAAGDDDIRRDLVGALDWMDATLSRRFQLAIEQGELAPKEAPDRLGRVAAALLHSLALRIRARQPDLEPEEFIRDSVAEILGV